MRTFVAIEIDDALRAACVRARAHLETADANVRWVAPELLHVTLKFLGEIPEDAVDAAAAVLAEPAARTPPFFLDFDRVGPFPNPRRPRVVAVRIREFPPALLALSEALEQGFEAALGVAADPRPFNAHLTLGRIRSPRGHGRLVRAMGDLVGTPFGRLRVDHVALVKSVLGEGGPTYTTLARPVLAGPSGNA